MTLHLYKLAHIGPPTSVAVVLAPSPDLARAAAHRYGVDLESELHCSPGACTGWIQTATIEEVAQREGVVSWAEGWP